jgi:alpha-mannosidase
VGELYLERHRAVQTTQAKAKLGNRRCEELLRQAELWGVTALGAAYPQAELEAAWRIVLLHQFHDILPGSSIHWVHEEQTAAYDEVRTAAEAVIDRACAAIAARVERPPAGRSLLVFNAASHSSQRFVEVEAGAFAAARPGDGGADSPLQQLAGGGLGFVASVPGSGWRRYDLVSGAPAEAPVAEAAAGAVGVVERTDPGGGRLVELSNGRLTATIDSTGHLTSVVDECNGRQLIAAGARGNVFQLHLDLPNDADAWDVDQGTFDRAFEIADCDSLEVIERGPVRAVVRLVRTFGNSRISQDISLVAGARQLEFVTDVDWHERHRFLKVAFPVAIRAAHASYEVQFGHIQRPTHANTSWDAARFEVAAQRWADLSEPGAGVALLNDCKYGYDIRGSVIRLSLLRGPTWPDPEADQGAHRFSYALLAHDGLAASLVSSESVADAAEAFNLGLRAVTMPSGDVAAASEGGGLAPTTSVVELDGAMVSSVKRADRGDDLVVRFWEAAGSHRQANLRLGAGSGLGVVGSAWLCDSLERPRRQLEASDGCLSLKLEPFELVTVKLTSQVS